MTPVMRGFQLWLTERKGGGLVGVRKCPSSPIKIPAAKEAKTCGDQLPNSILRFAGEPVVA